MTFNLTVNKQKKCCVTVSKKEKGHLIMTKKGLS